MNERIKLLANKAIRIVVTTDHCSGESESHTEVDLEKFAELIVRECVAIVWNDKDQKRILKHFGVEE